MTHFTVSDLVQTTLAALAFALFFLPPGYLLGTLSNALGFRTRSAAEKVLFSIACSLAVTPILVVLLTRATSYPVTITAFCLMALISVGLAVKNGGAGAFRNVRRSSWIAVGMCAAWFLLVQLSLVDLQVGQKLYLSYVSYDYSVRVPFVLEAARTGVPPLNPFCNLQGHSPVLRYYYYWYVVCALPLRMLGLSAKACLSASVFWSGLGLASLIPLFLKHGLNERENLRRKSLLGIALLAVTGLDLIPYLILGLRTHVWLGDMEWWDPNQVTSWLGSFLWVPHHVASLTACMLGLLVLLSVDEESTPRQTAWAAVIASLAFATAAGLSIYVTFTFAVAAVIWTFRLFFQNKIRTMVAWGGAGLISLLLSLPYLHDLLSRSESTGRSDSFLSLGFRDFPLAIGWLQALGVQSPFLLQVAKLPILLVVYALEFGFFAVAAFLYLRRDFKRGETASFRLGVLWMVLGISLAEVTFLQSSATNSNDFGFRGVLIVQFILLLLAAPILDRLLYPRSTGESAPWGNALGGLLAFTLVLGVAGTAADLVMLRLYAPLADSGKLARSEFMLGDPGADDRDFPASGIYAPARHPAIFPGTMGFAARTYWIREGFERLNRAVPPDALVQYNPVRNELLIMHLYSPRQVAVGDDTCGGDFGGEIPLCQEAFPTVATAFNLVDDVRGWDIDRFCDAWRLNILVATQTDPVWHDPGSWVWSRNALVANPAFRAIPCGSGAAR